MAAALTTLVRMSLTGALVIAAVLLARLCLDRAPRKYVCFLWLAVLFRLLCPVTLHVPVSAVPQKLESGRLVEDWTSSYVEEARIINSDMEGYSEAVNAGIPVQIDRIDEPEPPEDTQTAQHTPAAKYDFYVVTAADGVSSPKTIAETWLPVLAWVWLAGAVGLLAWSAVRYLRLRARLREAVRAEDRVFEAEGLASPFVLGILRPRIYLPWGMQTEQRRWVLLHERAHILRLDPLWKLLGWLALCLHWFNPLCWLAFSLAMQDMEGACDEAVVRALDGEERAAYSRLLLALSAGKPLFAATPLGFGEGNVKKRIRSVLRRKAPGRWMAALAVLVLAAVVLLFTLGPNRKAEEFRGLGDSPDVWPQRSFFAEKWTEVAAGQRSVWPVRDAKGLKKALGALLQESEWRLMGIVDDTGLDYYGFFPGRINWTADGKRWHLYLGRRRIYLKEEGKDDPCWFGYPIGADGREDWELLERLLALTEYGKPAVDLTPGPDMTLGGIPWGASPEEVKTKLPGAAEGDFTLTGTSVSFCGFRTDAVFTFGEDDKGRYLQGAELRFPEDEEMFPVVRYRPETLQEALTAVWGERRSGLLFPWWLRDGSKADPDRLLYWLSEDVSDETVRKSGVTAWMDQQVDPRTLCLDASGRNLAAGRQVSVERDPFTMAEVFDLVTRLAPDSTALFTGEEAGMVFWVSDPAEEARLKPLFAAWPWVKIEFRYPAEPVMQPPRAGKTPLPYGGRLDAPVG